MTVPAPMKAETLANNAPANKATIPLLNHRTSSKQHLDQHRHAAFPPCVLLHLRHLRTPLSEIRPLKEDGFRSTTGLGAQAAVPEAAVEITLEGSKDLP